VLSIAICPSVPNRRGRGRCFRELSDLARTFLSNPWKLGVSQRLADRRTGLKRTVSENLVLEQPEALARQVE